MTRSRVVSAVILPAGLIVLVGALAFFQYRWLGQVSDADRDRQRASVAAHTTDFANDFDREISRAYFSLQLSVDEAAGERWQTTFLTRYDAWRETARFPQMIAAFYVLDPQPGAAEPHLLKFDASARTFAPVPWPDALQGIHKRLLDANDAVWQTAGATSDAVRSATFRLIGALPPLDADTPALVIPMASMHRVETSRDGAAAYLSGMRDIVRFGNDGRLLIAALDRSALVDTLLPALIDKHFPGGEYRVQVLDLHTQAPIFASDHAKPIAEDAADASARLFAVRSDSLRDTIALLRPNASGSAGSLSIVIDQRASTTAEAHAKSEIEAVRGRALAKPMPNLPTGASSFMSSTMLGFSPAAWEVVLQHRDGSLEQAVTHARRRNLGISFGILAVLAVSLVLISVSGARARHLAEQQMDFVATVSHELRTPLAVIRSAAQNLSAGVVHDGPQAKRYGDLIDAESQRLTDMVEQVLEYAGISGGRRPMASAPHDIAAITEDVLTACAPLIKDAGFTLDTTIAPDLPPVMLDERAYRRALTNLIVNALKYGADGRWLSVAIHRIAGKTAGSSSTVHVVVSDRGRGVDPADAPHIFDAFYRGRDAKAQQIHGNGLGLSLVKHIAEAHGGRVTMESAPGAGAAFTLSFPA